eukprot:GAFH01000250.1.p7 GENE.GAFH01000250.1~~GAFH01000250.1.p7  ORF type:complete len:62 (-),score=4.43 GAFH01000250.1:590-775(-)
MAVPGEKEDVSFPVPCAKDRRRPPIIFVVDHDDLVALGDEPTLKRFECGTSRDAAKGPRPL